MFNFKNQIIDELSLIKDKGLLKAERVLESPQGTEITVNGKKLLNFSSNNYLGLANHPDVVKAAKQALDDWGYGLSSVRFICGTQRIHKQLENKISDFLGTESTILYSSCFDANGGFFETLTTKEDAILTDELNHASIIDGIRLSKAERKIFKHLDMSDLEAKLIESGNSRRRIIVTDGVFSMDGDIADLKSICNLADKHQALVMVDDSHATGFIGKNGRGTHEYHQVIDRVDIITSTLGKALGGAAGGFVSGRKEIIDLFRQRSRPYLFSNSLTPMIAATSLAVLELIKESDQLREKLKYNTNYFRTAVMNLGFDVKPGTHPIIPIMLYDAHHSVQMAQELINEGIFVISFSYPVVAEGKARIRVQISASHTQRQLDQALFGLAKAGRMLGIIK